VIGTVGNFGWTISREEGENLVDQDLDKKVMVKWNLKK
jgi:hypothetical protein